jgi:phosphopantetheinyl transferase (holo-ACP synthase)
MVVSDYLAESGKLTIHLEGAWAEAFKNLKGRGISVSVGTMRDHALAFCFIPASLFEVM